MTTTRKCWYCGHNTDLAHGSGPWGSFGYECQNIAACQRRAGQSREQIEDSRIHRGSRAECEDDACRRVGYPAVTSIQ